MSTDKSMYAPGPMGWGLSQYSLQEIRDKERRAFATLAQNQPSKIKRRPLRAVNTETLNQVKEAMKADGIDGGFSCRHVEKVIFGDFLSWLAQLIGSCFIAGTMVKMADGSEKPIEQIKIGDKVISHTGTIRAVTNTFVRKYSGKLYTTKIVGHPFDIVMTADHMMATVPWKGWRYDSDTADLEKINWTKAEDISIDDRFIIAKPELEEEGRNLVLDLYSILHNDVILCDNGTKVKNKSGKGKKVNRFISVTPSLLRLLGLYAAEGSTGKCRVQFTFNIDESETLAEEILTLSKGIFGIKGIKTNEPEHSRCVVRLESLVLEKFIKKIIPGNALTKKSPWFVWQSGLSGRLSFLLGWLDGDGSYRKDSKRVVGVSASRALASDLYNLALSCGLMVSGRKRRPHKRSKEAYNIEFSGQAVDRLSNLKLREVKSCKRHKYGIARKVKEITYQEVSDILVYDIEVEEDHSFVANGLISHNCVASGGMRAMTRRTLIESFILNEPEEIFGTKLVGTNNVAPYAPYSYRAGRKKGGIDGMMDGSFCNAHIEGAMDYGILPCSAAGLVSDTFPEPQNTRLYKEWGANDSLLNKFSSVGRTYKLIESENITDINRLWSALEEDMKPMMICSDWAFKPAKQHPTWKFANGDPVWIYTRDTRNSWAHNMTIDSALVHGSEKFNGIDNSWGDSAHKNGSFFILEANEMERWIRDAEIMTIGDIDMTDNTKPI